MDKPVEDQLGLAHTGASAVPSELPTTAAAAASTTPTPEEQNHTQGGLVYDVAEARQVLGALGLNEGSKRQAWEAWKVSPAGTKAVALRSMNADRPAAFFMKCIRDGDHLGEQARQAALTANGNRWRTQALHLDGEGAEVCSLASHESEGEARQVYTHWQKFPSLEAVTLLRLKPGDGDSKGAWVEVEVYRPPVAELDDDGLAQAKAWLDRHGVKVGSDG